VSHNPYAPPQADSAGPEPLARKRSIATVLSLLAPPIGMLYVVRPLRALVYLAIGVVILPGAAFLGAQGIADAALLMGLASLVWRLAAAVDGYRLARRWPGPRLPWYSRAPALVGFFALGLLVIGSLRAFVIEPFRIPSASMQPTLRVGDHILVRKTAYGWHVPLGGRRVITFAGPERGDVAVFRYPPDPALTYVMRVVGLPGETVAYSNKRLKIDGRELTTTAEGPETITNAHGISQTLARHREQLDNVSHAILLDPEVPGFERGALRDFPGRDGCQYQDGAFSCKVPAQHYFVMGDNRDNASDSRYWGFVPEDNFLGRVFLVWYSEQQPDRGGSPVQ